MTCGGQRGAYWLKLPCARTKSVPLLSRPAKQAGPGPPVTAVTSGGLRPQAGWNRGAIYRFTPEYHSGVKRFVLPRINKGGTSVKLFLLNFAETFASASRKDPNRGK